MKAVFMPPNIILLRMSRSHFKQCKTPQLISLLDVLGCLVNVFVIFGVYLAEDSFSGKREVKLGEIRNSETLLLLKS